MVGSCDSLFDQYDQLNLCFEFDISSLFFIICIITDCRSLFLFNLWIYLSLFSTTAHVWWPLKMSVRRSLSKREILGQNKPQWGLDLKLHIKSLAAWDEGQTLSDWDSEQCFLERGFIEYRSDVLFHYFCFLKVRSAELDAQGQEKC